MARILYDLCTAQEDVRPSPFCWMVKFALLHKGLDFETKALRFSDKHNFPDPDYGLLPVLDDNGELVRDSLEIANYLDKTYAQTPLIRSAGERAAFDFYRSFLGSQIFPAIGPMMFLHVHNGLTPEDQAYFRKTREARFKASLEDMASNASLPPRLESALKTLAGALEHSSFFGGEAANLSDYLLGGVFMWKRTVCAETVYETPEPIAAWFERLLDLYDGYGRSARRAA